MRLSDLLMLIPWSGAAVNVSVSPSGSENAWFRSSVNVRENCVVG